MTAVMYIAARPFLILLRTPAESFENACSYMQICMLGNFFVFEYNAISSVLNGTGDSKRPLIFVTISGTLNVFLDLLFVAGFKMGPERLRLGNGTVPGSQFCHFRSISDQKKRIFRLTRGISGSAVQRFF